MAFFSFFLFFFLLLFSSSSWLAIMSPMTWCRKERAAAFDQSPRETVWAACVRRSPPSAPRGPRGWPLLGTPAVPPALCLWALGRLGRRQQPSPSPRAAGARGGGCRRCTRRGGGSLDTSTPRPRPSAGRARASSPDPGRAHPFPG